MITCTKTLGDRGELVIPKDMREENGMTTHSRVELISTKHGVLIVPLKRKLSELSGLFKNLDGAKINNIIDEMYFP